METLGGYWRLPKMISVVCVYNNEASLRENLLKSLENQTSEHELSLVDNLQAKSTIRDNGSE